MEIILGVLASLFVQTVKGKFGGGFWTLWILAITSIALAALYSLVVYTGYLETVATILTTAGAFYAFVIQRFEGKSPAAPDNLPTA